MRSIEKSETRSESPTTFSCSESSPELKFYFGPTNKLNEDMSFMSFSRKGLRAQRSNNFPYQRPLFHNIFTSSKCASFLSTIQVESQQLLQFPTKLLRASKSKLSYRRHLSCLQDHTAKKLEVYVIRNFPLLRIIHKQQASDEVKLCTCQIRTCAGVGEHMFASGDWLCGGTANVKESRVYQVLENLYFTTDCCENPNQ